MFAIEFENSKAQDIVFPELHLWAILNRDDMRDYALNHGFVGMTVDVRKVKGTAPDAKFIVCFGRARREETTEAHPLLADLLKGSG